MPECATSDAPSAVTLAGLFAPQAPHTTLWSASHIGPSPACILKWPSCEGE
jgi:hypothetical protein